MCNKAPSVERRKLYLFVKFIFKFFFPLIYHPKHEALFGFFLMKVPIKIGAFLSGKGFEFDEVSIVFCVL